MRDVEVRVHLELGHLVGQVQESLGIHVEAVEIVVVEDFTRRSVIKHTTHDTNQSCSLADNKNSDSTEECLSK